MAKNRYYRKSTSITISTFYEQYQLKKYNFEPPYQRDMNVWEPKQKSFLMDTIFKNFPMPPIFLEQKIDDETGITTYDVIDGKQRLTAIISFIEGEVALPDTFGNDYYGNSKMNGLNFLQLKERGKEDREIKEYISDFWAYTLSVEYIENPELKIVDNIFDRLNREGKRLNAPELRKAKHYDSILYCDLIELRNEIEFSKLLEKLDKNRLEDVSFITELYLLTYTKKVFDGSESEIDKVFAEVVDEIDEVKSNFIKQKIRDVNCVVESLNLNYDKFYISGVSHLYAVWYLALYIIEKEIIVNEEIIESINEFYVNLRSNNMNEYVQNYKASMQSASRSKYSRKKRVKAILNYLGWDDSLLEVQ